MTADVLAVPEAPPVRTPEEMHAAAMARGAECRTCQLWGCNRGPVMPTIRPGAPLHVLGEAPGKTEVTEEEGFKGASGRILDDALKVGGLERREVSLNNVILCRPPGEGGFSEYMDELRAEHALATKRWIRRWAGPGAKGKADEREKVARIRWEFACKSRRADGETPPEGPPTLMLPEAKCRPRLLKDIEESNSRVLLAVGKQALVALSDHLGLVSTKEKKTEGDERPRVAPIKKQAGAPILLPDGRVLLSSFHPAFAMRDKCEYMPFIEESLARAARIAARGGRIDWNWGEENWHLNPSEDTVMRVLQRFLDTGAEITVDIETDDIDPHTCLIRCVGLGAVIDGRDTLICIPFRKMDGNLWWDDYAVQLRVALQLRRVLDENPLVFQNGQFDTTALLRTKLLTKRTKDWSDCYVDDETEFLTEAGWRRFDDVIPGLRLATLGKTGTLEFQHPIGQTDARLADDYYLIENWSARTAVSPNHRMWVRPKSWKKRGPTPEWQFRRVDAMLQDGPSQHYFRTAFTPDTHDGRTAYQAGDVNLDTNWMTLIGLVVTDGEVTYRGDRLRGIAISQEKNGRAAQHLESIRDRFMFSVSEQQRNRPRKRPRTRPFIEQKWRIDDPWLGALLEPWVGRYAANKHLPDFCLDLPYKLRAALLDALLAGDGAEANNRIQIFRSASLRLANQVQVLALTLGRPATFGVEHEGAPDQVYAIRVCRKVEIEISVQTSLRCDYPNGSVRGAVRKISSPGRRIVCFTVPNETLITRSQGKPAFHGNTLLLHKNTPSNDLPHGLGFLGRVFFEAPLWKEDAEHKATGGESDAALHVYNLKDVLVTMRCVRPLRQLVIGWGTVPQYMTDRKMAVKTRDMSELGLVLNEWQRGIFSKHLNQQCLELRHEFQELVGRPVNPRSAPQLRDLLYDEWDYLPVIATDGYEWEEDVDDLEDGSTSNSALTRLLAERVHNERHAKAIDKLLAFRANDKIRGTNTDNVKTYEVDWDAHGMDVGWAEEVRGYVYDKDLDQDVERVILPRRRGLSLVRSTFKNYVVPTGRLASGDPINFQNVPKRARGYIDAFTGKVVPINLRDMYVAPPGHVIVGADYEQIEARLYAVMAQDQLLLHAIRTGLDIHTLNAASLLAKPGQNVMDVYKWLKAKPKDELAYLRTVAKRFCVAEGELVLTNRGLVPIEQVKRCDRVWDGVEWVTHDGVVFQGEKEVIFHDGLWATPDHEVWLEDGRKVRFDEAVAGYHRLARTGEDRNPIRFVADDNACVAGKLPGHEVHAAADGNRPVHRLSSRREGRSLRQSAVRQVHLLSCVRNADQTMGRWGEGAGVATASDDRCQDTLGVQAGRVAVRTEGSHGASLQRLDPRGDHRARTADRSVSPREVAPRRRTARTYDLLNAGPRRRFTVSGRLVSNCFALIYGAQWQKIYGVMFAERDKATGERTFPNLKEKDTQEWEANWHRLHPETKIWQARCHAAYATFGFSGVPDLDYRRRFFPGGCAQENAIPNMTIQGFAASIANRALLLIAEEIPFRSWSYFSGLAIQVHDFIGVIVPWNRADEAKAVLARCMPYTYDHMLFGATPEVSWTLGQQ